MTESELGFNALEDALTVATLLIKNGYSVQMVRRKDGTAKYTYVLSVGK